MQSDNVALLNQILVEGLITPLFQPIYDLTSGHIYGYEALSRGPQNTELFAPDVLFPFAQEQGRLHELELLCRERAISRFTELELPGMLFLNVSASLLSSPDHQKGMTLNILKELGISQRNIVIELSEQHPYDQNGLSHQSVEHYRQMGFQVAIDDLGAGYSGLRLWSELRPNIVKLDKHFIEGIDRDQVKREFVRSIINIAQRLRCSLIAEGIEQQQELDQLLELGVKYGQGFFLQRPNLSPKTQAHPYLITQASLRRRFHNQHGETVQTLCRQSIFIESARPLIDVAQLFKQNKDVFALPVLESGKPVGIIRRHALHELFSTPYGRALYENKPALSITSTEVLIVESTVSLASVSAMLTDQDADLLNNEILIVKGGQYLGIGHLKDLLKRITELKIQNATYSNPLTLLPGNVPINHEINRRLQAEQDFYVAYFDLNNFKPFNDYYGYAKGDAIIQLVGSILRNVVSAEENFIGHVGGDDFVVIFNDENWCQQCQIILDRFSNEVTTFYDEGELREGGIWSKNRDGEHKFFEILSLAVGVVNPNPKVCDSHHFVAELAAQAKKSAKERGGNQIYQQPYQYYYDESSHDDQERCCS
ncbi:bifunctional diguanylate cyclase/phosphodiesterase [Marinomonas ostreistagni]|uniref:EAL and GGDEF domain-containing protein n=1 Tax=Marinomonas ostreistagni TaxID=359209 RepID=A0ABS0ZH12_9GAMM|nr:bifunctional diguanylate cyclase/phosphodiesterase [Marinomonas ostreistagni]MBJ7552623.1 EAL and GGDEF domain-containing protein [Marinomonas ostreistagni]